MTGQEPERRLKMKARRRSPVVLALGVLSALAAAPAAAAGRVAAQRRTQAATVDSLALTRPASAPTDWQEVPGVQPPAESTPASGPTQGPPAPPTRLEMIFQAGWQHTWPSTGLWGNRNHSLFSLDLGMTVRGDDGHRWGGAATAFWYTGYRRTLALKGIRRWTLEEASGSYLQLAPGVIIAGEDDQVDLSPGLLLEAELGNKWVALTTGVHVQSWSGDSAWSQLDHGTDLIYTLGGRVHGAIGAGVMVGLYLFVALAFAAGGAGGWN